MKPWDVNIVRGVCGLAHLSRRTQSVWLLSQDGDHELITAFPLIQTYTYTLIPGGSQLLIESLHISPKNTGDDTWRKHKNTN